MKYCIIGIALLLGCCLPPFASAQSTVTIDNAQPRKDNKGQIVDAHDGRVIQFGKKWYWYGTRYGATNGFTTANAYVCYSSADLTHWQYEGELLPNKPTGVYYRPHVVYNIRTKKYVLWYNWYPKLWDGQFGVAESDNPAGPFTIKNNNVQVKHQAMGVGDLGVFVNDDGKAYLSYNTIQQHKVSVELLDDNYTASTLQGSAFIAEHCEAGSMFKRNGLYYLLTDYTCCFCTQGSGAQVFTAEHPLGPYRYRQNINRYPGEAAPLLHDGKSRQNQYVTLEPKEANAIELWLDAEQQIAELQIMQHTGNRSGQCGEVDNPQLHAPIPKPSFKIHAWQNGQWSEINSKQQMAASAQQQAYRLQFSSVATTKLKIVPQYADTVHAVLIDEIIAQKGKAFTGYKTGKTIAQRPIIPAQQTYVMEVATTNGTQWLWMGDLWGSASDGIKGHDYQYWSPPLRFDADGLIQPLQFVNEFKLLMP